MIDYATARRHMVESQIRTNKVTDTELLAVLDQIPRELFVPQRLKGVAYVDEDLMVKPGRYLLEPLVLARLLQTASVQPSDKVLDVGCLTGYAAAVLGRLAGRVTALESDPELAAQAVETLAQLGIDNVTVLVSPLVQGYAKQAPYNVILIEGSVADVPDAIKSQLAEGGRLVTVVSGRRGAGRGTLFTKSRGVIADRAVFDAATPALAGFMEDRGFVF